MSPFRSPLNEVEMSHEVKTWWGPFVIQGALLDPETVEKANELFERNENAFDAWYRAMGIADYRETANLEKLLRNTIVHMGTQVNMPGWSKKSPTRLTIGKPDASDCIP